MCCLWGTQFPGRDKTTINTMKVKRDQLGKVGLSSQECCLLYWVHWCFHPRHQQECLAPMIPERARRRWGFQVQSQKRERMASEFSKQSKGKPGKRGRLEVGKLIPMLIFVNKILLEHKYEHWCTVCGCSHNIASRFDCSRQHGLQSPTQFISGSVQKNFTPLWKRMWKTVKKICHVKNEWIISKDSSFWLVSFHFTK